MQVYPMASWEEQPCNYLIRFFVIIIIQIVDFFTYVYKERLYISFELFVSFISLICLPNGDIFQTSGIILE